MQNEFGLTDELIQFSEKAESVLNDSFHRIDKISEYNQIKVLEAFRLHRVQEASFVESSGYGYDDIGRETLEKVYASVFHTESALVRPQITCGTHALSLALFGLTRPGDEILFPAGGPYDTLEEIVGIRDSRGSLKEWGVKYRIVPLNEDGSFNYDAIRENINEHTKLIEIQRSKGYLTRKTFSPEEIGELISFCKSVKPDLVSMVDNCYGEFTDKKEPTDFGADIAVGSLIKNPGGGLASSGGYVVGKKEYVEECAVRLTAPGIGSEVGSNFGILKSYFQGLFLAPSTVASALKTALFAAYCYDALHFKTSPRYDEIRQDIIQSVTLDSEEAMIAFSRGIQSASPVDSFVKPLPSDMPGYADKVIMAAGTFVSGASIELSCDGPVKPPYTVYLQGGLTYAHGKYGVLQSIRELISAGVVKSSDLC